MKGRQQQRGFTLIEVIVALAITAILLSMAIPAYRSLTLSNRIASYGNEFLGTLSFARSEALQRSARVAVCASSNGTSCSVGGSWTQGWLVYTDTGTLGQVDGTDLVLRYHEALKGQVTMVGSSLLSTYVAYAAQPAVTSNSTTSGNEYLFYSDYDMSDWSGNLHAVKIATDGSLANVDSWGGGGGAAVMLDAQNYSSQRNIVTINSSTGAAVPFRWANISATQQTSLGTATTGQAILNYIRGNTADEAPNGAKYRARNTVLGDIIHSTPVYWKDTSGNATVFVNANDGMMHAFDASKGSERFAFVPSQVIASLKNLTLSTYSVSHEYFVDGRLDVRNVTVSGSTKSILVGALGAGGKGLFAMDVTNVGSIASESDAASRILWEISSATTGYTNLGYTYGAPYLGTLESGTAAVIIGNGYLSANGHAELFVINANSGAKIAEIDTGYGTAAAPNGLSTPSVVDTDGDGLIDTAYAGDLDGHLFKFDLTNNTSKLLFTTSPVQPISTAPSILPHPNGGYMVTFTTGKILLDTDMSDTSTFYAYGTGDIRAGVMPTQTNCVHANTLGVSNTWRNGALTVQIISTTVTDSDIQLNVAGRPDLGWRLTSTAAATSSKMLAEFTIFWHHPNGKCSNDSGWIQNPPLDTSTSTKTSTPAAGSSDPTTSVSGSSGGGTGGSTDTSTPVDSSGVVVGGSTDSTTMTEFLRGDTASTIGPGRISWRVLQ